MLLSVKYGLASSADAAFLVLTVYFFKFGELVLDFSQGRLTNFLVVKSITLLLLFTKAIKCTSVG